jgi:uncharacterized protein DUF6817
VRQERCEATPDREPVTPVPRVPACAQTNVQLYGELADLQWPETEVARARDAYALAFELLSGKYRRSHRTFISHLVGTASIVAEVDGRHEMVLAALLHAAYSAGDWGRPSGRVADARMRAEVRDAVGADAEELIWYYSTIPQAIESLGTWVQAIADGSSPALARDLVILRLANQVEELQDYETSERPLRAIDVLGQWATTLDAREIADRLAEIASRVSTIELPAGFGPPRAPRRVVPPRSYRLSMLVKAREQLLRLTPRRVLSKIKRTARRKPRRSSHQ